MLTRSVRKSEVEERGTTEGGLFPTYTNKNFIFLEYKKQGQSPCFKEGSLEFDEYKKQGQALFLGLVDYEQFHGISIGSIRNLGSYK